MKQIDGPRPTASAGFRVKGGRGTKLAKGGKMATKKTKKKCK